MSQIKLSRQLEFDRGLAVKNTDNNQFLLVLLAAARAKQIADEVAAGQRTSTNPGMDALLEIQKGLIK